MRNIPILEILLGNAGADEDDENIQKKIKGTCIHVYVEKEKTKVFMIFSSIYPRTILFILITA